jgi:ubiquinone/menaquinone biosynthesis C-methylase UbiE
MRTLAGALIVCAALSAQVADQANRDYRDPKGRGRIAGSLVAEDRDSRQKPKELIAAAGIRPGMTVADVGTGAGYMLPHLSEAVGPGGRVYAEDIFPDFLASAKKRGAGLENVTYVLGNEKSAELPAGSQDVILVLDAYHHFDYPSEMISGLRRALKPDGRLVVVEYHKNEKSMANGRALKHIRLTRDEFVKEIESFGMKAVEVKEFTPDVQWIATFRRQ